MKRLLVLFALCSAIACTLLASGCATTDAFWLWGSAAKAVETAQTHFSQDDLARIIIPPTSRAHTPGLDDKTIIVDAGHGGSDRGCTGVSGRLEKEVNLEIARKLQTVLESQGVTVIMTRETDDAIGPTKEEDMAERIRIIETSAADAFVSIHQNEFTQDSSITGPQIFYGYRDTPAEQMAYALQEALNSNLDLERPRSPRNVPYDVLKPNNIPCCTVECGFFSNATEEELLQTDAYQEKLATLITQGLRNYFDAAAEQVEQ